MRQSELHFQTKLPKLDFKNSILIYDQIFQNKSSKESVNWLKKFKLRLPVQSGEKLKDLQNFPALAQKILKLAVGLDKEKLTIVSLGGGSVGDFAGFVASVLKRGVILTHVPTTWLSAMDSAHGGKTALNLNSIKNQIGTYYPAHDIYLVKSILQPQPLVRINEASGEYYKTVILAGGKLWNHAQVASEITADDLWKQLPELVAYKNKIVKKDPYEKKGLRHILNLGHTVGHVLESKLGLPHGIAVHLGLRFAYEWSCQLGIAKDFGLATHVLPSKAELQNHLRKIKNPASIFIQDKKVTANNGIRFIFIKKPGLPVVKNISLKKLVKEWQRQCL
jgi:3-dehydroquinate synthase